MQRFIHFNQTVSGTFSPHSQFLIPIAFEMSLLLPPFMLPLES